MKDAKHKEVYTKEMNAEKPDINKNNKKVIVLYSEPVYFFAIILLSFSVAMLTAIDFGVSMIVAPAYLLSLKLEVVTFGQCEYIIQGVLFLAFCILMKKVKILYFSSFLTGLIYGFTLDLWRALIPMFNPKITIPGSMNMPLRVAFFTIGVVLSSLAIALFFRVYLYPQVYDFFVKGISQKYHFNQIRFKQIFDSSCLFISVIMTLILFHKFVGIGVGTLIMTVVNGLLIGWCGKLLDRYFTIKPLAKKFSLRFQLTD